MKITTLYDITLSRPEFRLVDDVLAMLLDAGEEMPLDRKLVAALRGNLDGLRFVALDREDVALLIEALEFTDTMVEADDDLTTAEMEAACDRSQAMIKALRDLIGWKSDAPTAGVANG